MSPSFFYQLHNLVTMTEGVGRFSKWRVWFYGASTVDAFLTSEIGGKCLKDKGNE